MTTPHDHWKNHTSLSEKEFLSVYQPEDYPRPSVASDIVIFTVSEEEEENYRKLPEKELRVLLIKRGAHPYLGSWALPGGFVRPGETTGQTALRELKEETGLENIYLEQLYTFSDPQRDPRMWIMSCSHMALIDSSQVKLHAGDDASEARWFTLKYTIESESAGAGQPVNLKYSFQLKSGETQLSAQVLQQDSSRIREFTLLENDGLAFDHAKIIACALERLVSKLNQDQIAFNLAPPLFTLTELQQIYEIILGKPLLKPAFRRKIAPFVEETERYREHAGHRPSKLYRRKDTV